MARGRKKKPENTLLTALNFINAAQRASGSIEQVHCRMFGNWVVATNSVLTAAHPIAEDIACCPHTHMLIDALEQAPEAVTLTLGEGSSRLSVRSGDFQAVIPCIDATALPVCGPDAALALCDGRLRDALAATGSLVVDGAEKIVNATVQMRNGTIISSNGSVIIEAWHGIAMPELQIVPKTFITALQKSNKTITRFGCCETSFTVWFEDNSWLKTQLYPVDTELPELDKFLNIPVNFVPVPKGLFTNVKRLEPFSEDGQIYFTTDGLRVMSKDSYAIDAVKNLPNGLSFGIKSLLAIAEYADEIHFNAMNGISVFMSKNKTVRGAIVNNVFQS